MYSAISMDGFTWGPMIGILMLLGYSIIHGHRFTTARRGYWPPSAYEADTVDGCIYLVLGVAVYAGTELINWGKSFDPPMWLMLVVAAPPILLGAWNLIGSVRRRYNRVMKMKYFKLWQVVSTYHLGGVIAFFVAHS